MNQDKRNKIPTISPERLDKTENIIREDESLNQLGMLKKNLPLI